MLHMTKKIYSLLLAGLLLLSACTQKAPETPTTTKVKIGMIAPLTGDVAALGEEMKAIAEYVLPSINEKYKSQGYEFEIVYEDGKCNAGSATNAFSKLTDIDGVKFVFGGACSGESLAIAPLLEGKKVVAVSATSSNPDIEGKSPYLFSLSYNDETVTDGLTTELSKYKKVALLSEQSEYNTGIKKKVEEKLAKTNVEIVANEEFAKGSSDVRNVLQKIKAANPDVILLNPNVGVTSETVVKQLAEIKDWKVAKVGVFNLMAENVLKASPEVLEGAVVIDVPFVNDAKFLSYRDEIIKAKGELDDLGNYYSATVVDAVNVLAEAIVKSGNDSEKAKEWLSKESTTGNIGKISFGGKNFVQGITFARFVITNGKAEQSK